MAKCFPNVSCLFSWTRKRKEKKEKLRKKIYATVGEVSSEQPEKNENMSNSAGGTAAVSSEQGEKNKNWSNSAGGTAADSSEQPEKNENWSNSAGGTAAVSSEQGERNKNWSNSAGGTAAVSSEQAEKTEKWSNSAGGTAAVSSEQAEKNEKWSNSAGGTAAVSSEQAEKNEKWSNSAGAVSSEQAEKNEKWSNSAGGTAAVSSEQAEKNEKWSNSAGAVSSEQGEKNKNWSNSAGGTAAVSWEQAEKNEKWSNSAGGTAAVSSEHAEKNEKWSNSAGGTAAVSSEQAEKDEKWSNSGGSTAAVLSSEWEKRKVVSGDKRVTMEAEILFAGLDQFNEEVQGYGACSVLSVTLATWMAVHGDRIFPTRTFNDLIIQGAREWLRMCPEHKLEFNDGHFDLETALTARTCQLVANQSKSFMGTFKSDYLKRELNTGLMSFEEIWDGIGQVVERSSGPVYYVVGWDNHFFLLRADKTEYFITETIGRKLGAVVNDRAYMIRFGESTRIRGKGAEIVTGKECCRIYIQRFIVDTVFENNAWEHKGWDPEEFMRMVQVGFTCIEPPQPLPVLIRNEPAKPAEPAQPVPVMIRNKPPKPAQSLIIRNKPAIQEKKNEEATNGDLQLVASSSALSVSTNHEHRGRNKLRIWLKSATLLIRFLVLWLSLFILVKWASLIDMGFRVINRREWPSPQAGSVHHCVLMEMPREKEKTGDLHLPVNSRIEVTS